MKNVTNLMQFDGVFAEICFDPEIEMFRGEFIGLNGGADFYADNVKDLREEGEKSLGVFLMTCKEEGIEPFKTYSGKFNTRISPEKHQVLEAKAKGEGISLNAAVDRAIEQYIQQ